MTRPDKTGQPRSKRKREIINALSELSRDGWAKAKLADYQPLERELKEIRERKVTVRDKVAALNDAFDYISKGGMEKSKHREG